MPKYRPNVAIILRLPKSHKILITERINNKNSWQFPQGGVDEGEDLISALYRETDEEVGLSKDLYVIKSCRTGYKYTFPNNHLKKGLYKGQIQTYFLCDFLGDKKSINLNKYGIQEFSNYKWIDPNNFKIKWAPKFKRKVFKKVFKDFFGIKL